LLNCKSIIPQKEVAMSMKRRGSMKIVPPGKKKCIWMEAGVVSFKLCDNNYDCPTCAYDHAMQAKVEREREAVLSRPIEVPSALVPPPQSPLPSSWVERMMQLPASRRQCRYMLTGEVSRKICANAYDCGRCSFDEMMQQRIQVKVIPVGSQVEIGGFTVAEELYYHDGHTWARPEYGGRVRVGIDDFAQRLVGRLSKVELPRVGSPVRQGEVGIELVRNGHRAQALCPVDGIVVHVNEEVLGNPSSVNESPYEEGWLFVVEPTQLRKNLKALYYGDTAKKFIQQERDSLLSMATGMRIAADGGIATEDLLEELGEAQWKRIVSTFLKTQS
jgi:glycine cleavage system H lipoate-binding protein